jgi:hypothetical protein
MCVVVAGILVTNASATKSTIVPGVGIGKVKLGMTLTQVKKALGQPQTVNKRMQLPAKQGYIEYGWNFSSTWVGFVNTNGVLHASLVGTVLVAEKTGNGVGVGVSPETLRRKLPVASCFQEDDGTYRPGSQYPGRIWTYCLFRSPRPVTVFHVYCTVRGKPVCPGQRVGEVVIRRQSLPVPYA